MAATEYTDAIALLKADHREVGALFEEFESYEDAESKQRIADKICTELKIHTMIEEELFYPVFVGKIDEALMAEAYVEHDGAKVLINDIMSGSVDDEFFEAKVKVLSEAIEHHVKEEEAQYDGMFAQCRNTDVDLVALGEQMFARKTELMELADTEGLPPAQMHTVMVMED